MIVNTWNEQKVKTWIQGLGINNGPSTPGDPWAQQICSDENHRPPTGFTEGSRLGGENNENCSNRQSTLVEPAIMGLISSHEWWMSYQLGLDKHHMLAMLHCNSNNLGAIMLIATTVHEAYKPMHIAAVSEILAMFLTWWDVHLTKSIDSFSMFIHHVN